MLVSPLEVSVTPILTADADTQYNHQMTAAKDRLVAHYADYDDVAEDKVRRTFDTVTKRYTDAHVRAFVPILVERGVRRELGH